MSHLKTLSAEQLAAIDQQILAGNTITAIRDYRGFTDSQLVDAKKFIEDRLEQLLNEHPSRFPTACTPPTANPQIIQQITPIPELELRTLRSTLNQIEKLLYGGNYAVTLSVSAATLPTSDLPVNELMQVLFPESTPHEASVLRVHSEELVTDVTECLAYGGHCSWAPFSPQVSEILLPEYWRQLSALAPLDSSSIYSYSSDTGLPGYHVFWFFAYLVHDLDADRCVVITGMASD